MAAGGGLLCVEQGPLQNRCARAVAWQPPQPVAQTVDIEPKVPDGTSPNGAEAGGPAWRVGGGSMGAELQVAPGHRCTVHPASCFFCGRGGLHRGSPPPAPSPPPPAPAAAHPPPPTSQPPPPSAATATPLCAGPGPEGARSLRRPRASDPGSARGRGCSLPTTQGRRAGSGGSMTAGAGMGGALAAATPAAVQRHARLHPGVASTSGVCPPAARAAAQWVGSVRFQDEAMRRRCCAAHGLLATEVGLSATSEAALCRPVTIFQPPTVGRTWVCTPNCSRHTFRHTFSRHFSWSI